MVTSEAEMAYDQELAERVRMVLKDVPGISKKEMFGGVGFLVDGNMACGVIGSDLIVRVGPPTYEEALAEPFTNPFDFTGRPMKGWITVEPRGSSSDQHLSGWVNRGVAFALSLPNK